MTHLARRAVSRNNPHTTLFSCVKELNSANRNYENIVNGEVAQHSRNSCKAKFNCTFLLARWPWEEQASVPSPGRQEQSLPCRGKQLTNNNKNRHLLLMMKLYELQIF